ncbi:hypothetical protein Rhopal_007007-T1 [Rhodotorula paludigena]|uniref:RRM domain-containing protein n=1 Tax=Rhodotorula paludigena TaxID=86838 RepID=A0AAV5GUQ0_9BASI|nr:hypothetical protein Rhopal_007007-T1 [Rhodotorula paludigena]
MADQEYNNNGAGESNRSPSPRRDRDRSRSPMRVDERDRRDGGDRGRSDNRHDGGNPGNNLHVSGLSLRVEERDLEDLFGKHGRIQKVQVMRDPHTKESRGFAFVTMETAEDAEACISNLSATELMGRTMNVEKARRGRARTPTPGQYHGPPKRFEGGGYGGGYGGGGYGDRMYDPRSRGGGRDSDRYDRGGGYDRYDDRRGGGGRYDDRYGGSSRGYDDRDRGAYAIPMRGDDRGGSSRGYSDRDRYDSRGGYDDRRGGRY